MCVTYLQGKQCFFHHCHVKNHNSTYTELHGTDIWFNHLLISTHCYTILDHPRNSTCNIFVRQTVFFSIVATLRTTTCLSVRLSLVKGRFWTPALTIKKRKEKEKKRGQFSPCVCLTLSLPQNLCCWCNSPHNKTTMEPYRQVIPIRNIYFLKPGFKLCPDITVLVDWV